jgi:hypothetical protein
MAAAAAGLVVATGQDIGAGRRKVDERIEVVRRVRLSVVQARRVERSEGDDPTA